MQSLELGTGYTDVLNLLKLIDLNTYEIYIFCTHFTLQQIYFYLFYFLKF